MPVTEIILAKYGMWSTWSLNGGIVLYVSSFILSFLGDMPNIELVPGIPGFVLICLYGYFKFEENRIKKQDQRMKKEKHDEAMAMVRQMRNGDIEYDSAFVNKFFD